MKRSEPSFVPGWLKGGNEVSISYQPDNQSHQENDSPLYVLSPDRSTKAHSRRNFPSGSIFDNATIERASKSRFVAYNHSLSPLELEQGGRRDCGSDQDWESDKTFGSGRGDQRLGDSFQLKHNFSAASKLDLGISFYKTLSLGSQNRSLENGSSKTVIEAGSPSANATAFSSIMKPAAFDRNFPSLVPHDKPVPQSSLGDVSKNGRPFWQVPSPKVNAIRTASGLGSSGSGPFYSSAIVSGAEDSRVLSAETPIDFLSSNGLTTANHLKSSNDTVTAPSGVVPFSHSNVPKMAEALVQNSSRVRAAPQQAIENQRLEELAWKQSRQLIPMKPSLPRTMVQGLSPRDKAKPKVGRLADGAVAGLPKFNHPKTSTQLSSPLYRLPVSTRPEPLKYQPAMLVVPKINKDASSGVSSGRLDAFASQASSSFIANVGVAAGSSSGLNSGLNILSRKPKQSLNRRSLSGMTAGPVSDNGGMSPRLKDVVTGVDDKKMSSQAQNRSNFFNALRKKAAAATTGIILDSLEVPDVAPLQKRLDVGSVGESPHPSDIISKHSRGEESIGCQIGIPSDEPIIQAQDITSLSNLNQPNSKLVSSDAENKCSDAENKCSDSKNKCIDSENKCNFVNDNVLRGKADTIKEIVSTSSSSDCIFGNVFVAGGSEEEEAEFLKSLGWVENPDDEEDALTEEEISSFLKQHMSSITSRGLCSQYSLRFEKLCIYTEHSTITPSSSCLGDGELVAQSQVIDSSGSEMNG